MKATTSKAPTHAGAVYAALCELWPKGAFAVLPEVGNSTGAGTKRHADAVVMSLWPSRGLWVAGVEIKVSRSDWLAELRNAEKAEEVAAYCDHWYVAVSRADIIAEGEMPKLWGLIACDSGKAKVIKAAPELTPKALDRGFVAAMLRRAAEFTAPDAWVVDKLAGIHSRSREEAEARCGREAEMWKKKAEELSQSISEFENKTGMNIRGGYRSEHSYETFRAVKRALEEGDADLDFRAERMEAAAKLMREAAALIRAPKVGEAA